MPHKEYQICNRCIMDTTDVDIIFDENGVCNHCKNYFERVKNEMPPKEEREKSLMQIVAKIKKHGNGKKYDCIAGVSGGTDSTYAAYHLKKLGLRPLIAHLDNGWNSELSVDNIKNIVSRLDFDLYTHVIDWEEFKNIQLSYLKVSVVNAEAPTDHAISSLLFSLANKYNIKYIIGGGNITTEGINPPLSWAYYNQDLRNLKSIHKRYGSVPIRTFPTLSLFKYFYLVMFKGIRIIPILNYLDYNKSEAKQVIEKELGWRDYGGKHFESVYTRFYQGYYLPKKFGFDKRKPHLSSLICSGEITRHAALEMLKEDAYVNNNLKQDKEFVLKKFEMTEEQFEKLLNLPNKKHTDYPNHLFLLEKMSGLKNIFKKIATKA